MGDASLWFSQSPAGATLLLDLEKQGHHGIAGTRSRDSLYTGWERNGGGCWSHLLEACDLIRPMQVNVFLKVCE